MIKDRVGDVSISHEARDMLWALSVCTEVSVLVQLLWLWVLPVILVLEGLTFVQNARLRRATLPASGTVVTIGDVGREGELPRSRVLLTHPPAFRYGDL